MQQNTVSIKTKLTGKKAVFFSFLCCLVYFTSYMTRIDYAAVLVEIISDLGVSKEIGSIAVTGSFVTYGLGQLFSGYLGDRIQPKYIIGVGLICTTAINISMTFLPNIYIITVFWCFNGLFQAMMWPPLVRLMTENLDQKAYTRTSTLVASSALIATMLEYLIASATVAIASWRWVFAISSCIATVTITVWFIGTKGICSRLDKIQPKKPSKAENDSRGLKSAALASGLFIIMLCIVAQGVLRDGITTWMPTYIKDVFNLGSSSAILTVVILPIFSISSISFATALYNKIKNELTVSAVLFASALAASLIMIPMFKSSIIVSIVMMAIITGCMHGINHMLISLTPTHFIKYGKVSTISGMLNSCTYVGSAISTYAFAIMSEKYGWYFLIITWSVLSTIGAFACFLIKRKWKNFCN